MTGTQAQTNPTTQAARRGRIEPGAVAASALAFGALSLPDPDRLTPARRRLLTLGRAAFLGWYTWDLTRRNPVPEVPATALWAVTGASLSLAFAPLDEATDRWLSGHLRRRGVQRPRLALALIGAGLGAGLALDAQMSGAADEDADLLDPENFFDTVEVPAAARALVTAMLEAVMAEDTAAPGLDRAAAILREQLDQAKASILRHEQMATDVFFSDLEDATRVVPHAQTWPVRAHFEAGDLPLMIELTIGDGHLGGLNIMHRDQDLGEDDPRWEVELLDVLERWPTPEEVRLVIETGEGYRPVG